MFQVYMYHVQYTIDKITKLFALQFQGRMSFGGLHNFFTWWSI